MTSLLTPHMDISAGQMESLCGRVVQVFLGTLRGHCGGFGRGSGALLRMLGPEKPRCAHKAIQCVG